MKRCSHCRRRKPPDAFCLDSGALDGYDHQCKDCRRDYHVRNREKHRESNRRYVALHGGIGAIHRVAQNAYPVRQRCAVTSCKRIGERHHLDYTKPLEIVWLCRKHHARIHKR